MVLEDISGMVYVPKRVIQIWYLMLFLNKVVASVILNHFIKN